jgi:hypothetical protein
MSSEQQNVRVVCRFKPLGPTEKPASLAFSPDGRGVETFAFERVFRGAKVANQQVYAQTVGDLAESAVRGINVTVFAYGQTGSGKTHTMSGTPDDPGIIPRFLEEVFDRLDGEDDAKCETSVQFVEIYNEEIFSLLPDRHSRVDEGKKSLSPIIDNETRETVGWVINGAKPSSVNDKDDVMRLFELGQKRRHTGATLMNNRSSRSHSVLILEISRTQSTKRGGKVVKSRVVLVDLAGSERQEKTGATGDRFEEAKNINQSLLALGNVITTLSEGDKRAHVKYRDSELTKVLQASLGGNSKTLMIIACSEAESNRQETVSTLRYGARASKIRNEARVNETMTLEQAMARIAELEKKLAAGQVTPRVAPSSPVHSERKRVEELEGQLVSALRRAEDAEALLEEVQRDMEATETAMSVLESRVKSAEGKAEDRRVTVLGMQSERDELREQHRAEEGRLGEEIAALKLELEQGDRREASLSARVEFLELKVREAAEDTADIETLSAHVDKKFAECNQLKKDVALLKDACACHERREQELQKDRDEARQLLEAQGVALAEAEKKLEAVVRQEEAKEQNTRHEEDSDEEVGAGPMELQLQTKLLARTAAIYHELHAMGDGGDCATRRAIGTNTDNTGFEHFAEELSALQARQFGQDGKVRGQEENKIKSV